MSYRGRFTKRVPKKTANDSSRNWGTGVDVRHSDPSMEGDQGFPELKSLPLPSVPDYAVDEYDPSALNAQRFASRVMEPPGHDGNGRAPKSSDVYDGIESDYVRHSIDLGATLKNTASMVMRSFTQTFATLRTQSLPPASDDNSAVTSGEARRVLRGFNSLALNNPGDPEIPDSGNYVRQGYEITRVIDRSMPLQPMTHTERPVLLNTADIAKVTQPLSGAEYTPYGSPFESVASLGVGPTSPMQRREPRQWDQSAVTDGSEQTLESDSAQYLSWGL